MHTKYSLLVTSYAQLTEKSKMRKVMVLLSHSQIRQLTHEFKSLRFVQKHGKVVLKN